jgi:hypothetical protein
VRQKEYREKENSLISQFCGKPNAKNVKLFFENSILREAFRALSGALRLSIYKKLDTYEKKKVLDYILTIFSTKC